MAQQMTPPDSDARCPWITSGEYSGRCLLRRNHAGPHKPDDPREPEKSCCDPATWDDFAKLNELQSGAVLLPLPLAQRILAALEAAASDYERLKVYGATPIRAVIVELRAQLPKEPK